MDSTSVYSELTENQKGIYFDCLLEKEYSRYNLTSAICLTGDLNEKYLYHAMLAVVEYSTPRFPSSF